VRHFRNILFALAALLWLPASAHCQLESLPGFEFFQCSIAGQTACHQSQDCGDCGCFAVEQSQYKSETQSFTLPSPDLQLVASLPLLPELSAWSAEVSRSILTAAPPPLLKTWQFASRSALPVRAPSFFS